MPVCSGLGWWGEAGRGRGGCWPPTLGPLPPGPAPGPLDGHGLTFYGEPFPLMLLWGSPLALRPPPEAGGSRAATAGRGRQRAILGPGRGAEAPGRFEVHLPRSRQGTDPDRAPGSRGARASAARAGWGGRDSVALGAVRGLGLAPASRGPDLAAGVLVSPQARLDIRGPDLSPPPQSSTRGGAGSRITGVCPLLWAIRARVRMWGPPWWAPGSTSGQGGPTLRWDLEGPTHPEATTLDLWG